MSTKITINIPNIASIITLYDQIRVYRSTSPDGVYEEITDAVESPAILTGTIAEPFTINGLTLNVSSKTINQQSTTFTSADPVTLLNALTELNTNLTDLAAGDDGGGRLQLTSISTGSDGRINIEPNSTAATLFGLNIGDLATGKNARLNLVAGQTEYVFLDAWGGENYYYKTDYYNSGSTASSGQTNPIQGINETNPPEKIAQHTSPRALCLYRGRTHTFLAKFYNDMILQDIPLVPNDATKYPKVTIIDVNGQVVANALATELIPGKYSYDWAVPETAILSDDDRRYKCQWDFIADNGRQLTHFIEFDVKDPDIEPTLEDQALKQLVLYNKDIHFRFVTSHKPYDINCDIIMGDQLIHTATIGDMTIEPFNGNFVYSFTVSNTLYETNAEIVGIWDILDTPSSFPRQTYQVYLTTSPEILPYVTSLRMIIDKYRKAKNLPQHYDDGELLEYLYRGAEILNAMFPTTNWAYTAWPQPLKAHLFLAAAVYGLNAQHLLEVDLQFSFGGQSVTLDYDHSGGLESAISRMWDWLLSQVPAAKTAFVRAETPVGVTAVTPNSYRIPRRVFRLGNVRNGGQVNMNYFNYFQALGLF